MIFLVIRIDYDNMENRDPLTEKIVGYCEDEKEASEALWILARSSKRYTGWMHGAEGNFPKFRTEAVDEMSSVLRKKG